MLHNKCGELLFKPSLLSVKSMLPVMNEVALQLQP